MQDITVNNPIIDNRDAETQREITEHLQEERRAMAKCRGRHQHITKHKPGVDSPAEPVFDVLRWKKLEHMLKSGRSFKASAVACGLTRAKLGLH